MPIENNFGSEFLREKYQNLHNSPEVKSAVRNAQKSGEKIPNDPTVQIQSYLDRLERLAINPVKDQKRELIRGESRPHTLVNHLREMLMREYIRQNKEKMAEGAARVEERAARQLGIEAHYGEQGLAQRGEIAVEDLEKSLDNWIMYLTDANEPYPAWFRYYAFRNILGLADYDKEKQEFPKRSKGTARLFPDIDRGALAEIQNIIEVSRDPKKLEIFRQTQKLADTPDNQLMTKEESEKFAKLPFAQQYAKAIKRAGEITDEMRQETRGKWIKYQQNTDPTALWASLQNKGTAWCTKGFATAQQQLQGGDFYVYYSLDNIGKPTIPRVAIRMQEGRVAEMRGVADNEQNIEANMINIAEKQVNELPGAEKYKKASGDMKQLTLIETKTKSNQPLSKEDLTFLYEINSKIVGFGYKDDPRIKEIRDQRNPKEDAPIVFDCQPNEIAWNQDEINQNTKAYVGIWNFEVFQKLKACPNIKNENLFEQFPDKKIFLMEDFKTDPTIMSSAQSAKKYFDDNNYYHSDWSDDLLAKTQFSQETQTYNLVKFTVVQLGFPNGATTEQIYDRATKELGLELCPAEVGPNLRTQYVGKEWMLIAMDQISDRLGSPDVFDLGWRGDQLALDASRARPSFKWRSVDGFVFSFRK